MNNSILLYIPIFLFSVFISSCSQIVLKKCADKQHKSKLHEYLNLGVLSAYAIFFASSLITIFAYRELPISFGPILEASGYIYIAVLSRVFLGERITKRKLAGYSLIVTGIVVFTVL